MALERRDDRELNWNTGDFKWYRHCDERIARTPRSGICQAMAKKYAWQAAEVGKEKWTFRGVQLDPPANQLSKLASTSQVEEKFRDAKSLGGHMTVPFGDIFFRRLAWNFFLHNKNNNRIKKISFFSLHPASLLTSLSTQLQDRTELHF